MDASWRRSAERQQLQYVPQQHQHQQQQHMASQHGAVLQLNATASFADRRKLVRDLRLAAMRASVVPPRPARQAPPVHDSAVHGAPGYGTTGYGTPGAAEPAGAEPRTRAGMSQLDAFESAPAARTTTVVEESVVKRGASKVTEIHHHHHHHYYEPNKSPVAAAPAKPNKPAPPVPAAPAPVAPAPREYGAAHEPATVATSPIRVTARRRPEAAAQPAAAAATAVLDADKRIAAAIARRSSASQKAVPAAPMDEQPVILKARELLDNARRNSQLKKAQVQQRAKRAARSSVVAPTPQPPSGSTPPPPPPGPPPLVLKPPGDVANLEGSAEPAKEQAGRSRLRTASMVLGEVESEAPKWQAKAGDDVMSDDEELEASTPTSAIGPGFVLLSDPPKGTSNGGAGDDAEVKAEEEEYDNEDEDEDDDEDDDEALDPVVRQQREAERSEKLQSMLHNAERLTDRGKRKAMHRQGTSTALIPFGEVLQGAACMSPDSAASSGRLPRFATSRELTPIRPPPEVASRPSTGGSGRTSRSLSQGTETERKAIEKEGWLLKMPRRTRWLGSGSQPVWKKRYFKLTGKILFYMVSPEAKVPKRMLDLSRVEIVTDPAKLGKTPTVHSMMLFERGRPRNSFRVCADSFKEILAWYSAIVNNAVLFCFNTSRSLPPKDNTPLTREQLIEIQEKKKRAALPKPQAPREEDFYPLFQRPASYYDILGVPADAPTKVIRRAYYKLAPQFHPDKNQGVSTDDFALLSEAHKVLKDDELRAEYDLGEKVKEVLRRGFDCTIYLPVSFEFRGKRKVPTRLAKHKATVFTDGKLKCLFHQPTGDEEMLPLRPDTDNMFEMRFVQRVNYGRNDKIIYQSFLHPLLQQQEDPETADIAALDNFLVLHGSKLPFDLYMQLDSVAACTEMVEGFRIIRGEASVLFKQTLAKMKAEGMD